MNFLKVFNTALLFAHRTCSDDLPFTPPLLYDLPHGSTSSAAMALAASLPAMMAAMHHSRCACGLSTRGFSCSSSLFSLCKSNCGLKKCSKCPARSRALKSTSRGSEDVQLHNNELKYITYLAGDPKRKEWGLSCWHSLIYKPTYKVPSNVDRISIYVKYMSNTNGRQTE